MMDRHPKLAINIAKSLLKNGYRWIARDEDGSLFAYKDEPHRGENVWFNYNNSYWFICSSNTPLFEDIKWIDKEPTSLDSIIHPQLLTDSEKRYLECVLKPLPKAMTITKVPGNDVDCLRIEFIGKRYTYFPCFKNGTMYQGMKHDKLYTPEELGLNLGEKE